MTRPSPFSVRGRRALAVMRDEREMSTLRRQLDRLGMNLMGCDPDEAKAPNGAFDVIIVAFSERLGLARCLVQVASMDHSAADECCRPKPSPSRVAGSGSCRLLGSEPWVDRRLAQLSLD